MFQLTLRWNAFTIILLPLFLQLLSCSGERPREKVENLTPALDNISQSFVVTTEGDGKKKVAIRPQALGKEFLLQTVLIPQAIAPLGNSLKSRIIHFKKEDGRLIMSESIRGNSVTDELPMSLPLASFHILEQTQNQIVFDFNEGMNSIRAATEWYASDTLDGTGYKADFSSYRVRFSSLEEVNLTHSNHLFIRQAAQLAISSQFGLELHTPVVFSYYLTPYLPNPSFKPSHTTSFKQMGFFEVAPLLVTKKGRTVVYASKWDLRRPIIFSLSSNTPAEFKEAVRDGVLYWNLVMPGAPLRVQDAPPGISAPDISHNIIQWVNWDRSERAYADAQIDPRTGEVLHAQIYMPSVFAVGSKAKARELIRRTKKVNISSQPHSHTGQDYLQKSLRENAMCDLEAYSVYDATFASVLTSTESTDQHILRISQDLVRAIIAHEVGHVLGLRHNFAGSLGAQNYLLSERKEIVARYFYSDSVMETVIPSSSVMDYLEHMEESLVGARIRRKLPALAYDRIAMAALYDEKVFKSHEVPPFCTDTNLPETSQGKQPKFNDCQKGDVGTSIIEYAAWAVGKNLEDLPFQIMTSFIASKSNETFSPGSSPIEDVSFNAEEIAKWILSPRQTLVARWMEDKRYFLNVFRQFGTVNTSNVEEVLAAERKYYIDQISVVGGIDKVFFLVPPDFYSNAKQVLSELLNKEEYLSGTVDEDIPYRLNTEELEIMKRVGENLLNSLPSKLADADLSVLYKLHKTHKKSGTELGNKLIELFSKRIDEYVSRTIPGEEMTAEVEVPVETLLVLSTPPLSSTDKPSEKTQRVKVNLSKFYYPLAVRTSAANLFKSGERESLDWGVEEKNAHKEKFRRELEAQTGLQMEKIKPEDQGINVFPEEAKKTVIKWLIENKRVLGSF